MQVFIAFAEHAAYQHELSAHEMAQEDGTFQWRYISRERPDRRLLEAARLFARKNNFSVLKPQDDNSLGLGPLSDCLSVFC